MLGLLQVTFLLFADWFRFSKTVLKNNQHPKKVEVENFLLL